MSADVMADPATGSLPLRRQEWFFRFCAAAAVLVFLGRNSFFGAEALTAEAAREACEYGRWLPLCINFRAFPGLHLPDAWCVGAMFSLFGISEFAARLPAALAFLILLAGVRDLALSLFDRRTSLLAGWLTLGGCGLLYLGRSVSGNVSACAAAIWAIAWYYRVEKRDSFFNSLVFWLLAAGSAACGRGEYLLIPAAFLLADLHGKQRRKLIFSARGAAAFLLVCVLAALWEARLEQRDLMYLPHRIAALSTGGSGAAIEAARRLLIAALRRSGQIYAGLYVAPLIILPWTLLAVAAVAGMAARFRTLPDGAGSLLGGALLTFLICALPAPFRWTNYLPFFPLLAPAAAAGLLELGREDWKRWAVIATRSGIVLAASLCAVSPVALPVCRRLLKIELPLAVLLALPIMGLAVLVLMLLDSHPARPLCKLTGLPHDLASTILGGTLISICLISLVVPSLRGLRSEKPFLRSLAPRFSELDADSVFFIGSFRTSAAVLFYTGLNAPCTIIAEGDLDKFKREVDKRRGAHLAIIARRREKRELEFLRRCAAETGLKIDVDSPDLREGPAYGDGERRRGCWLVTAPTATEEKKVVQPSNK